MTTQLENHIKQLLRVFNCNAYLTQSLNEYTINIFSEKPTVAENGMANYTAVIEALRHYYNSEVKYVSIASNIVERVFQNDRQLSSKLSIFEFNKANNSGVYKII